MSDIKLKSNIEVLQKLKRRQRHQMEGEKRYEWRREISLSFRCFKVKKKMPKVYTVSYCQEQEYSHDGPQKLVTICAIPLFNTISKSKVVIVKLLLVK